MKDDTMAQMLLLIQLLTAATAAGMQIMPLLQKASALIIQRHGEGKTITADDLRALFDVGDAVQAAALAQFEATLADPNTPKLA
jgi:hypothetical protein